MLNNFEYTVCVKTQEEIVVLGSILAKNMQLTTLPLICYLKGDLGAGKTTLVREILTHMGFAGVVISPSFSIMELYEFSNFQVIHLDLYRMKGIEELELLGVTDFINNTSIMFIEWPENGGEQYFKADLMIDFYLHEEVRELKFSSYTLNGGNFLKLITNELNIT